MSEDVREDIRAKISAFMDGEVGDFEARRTLKEIAADAELKRKWYRYHLASSAMRDELPGEMVDLSSRIRSAIDIEARPRRSLLAGPLGRVAIAASVAMFTVLGVQYAAPLVGIDIPGMIPGTGTSTVKTAANNNYSGSNDAGFDNANFDNTNSIFPETPQFQLPRGFDLPQVSARTVSVDSGQNVNSQYTTGVTESATEAQIRQFQERALRAYVEDRMLRHTERISLSNHQGMLPFARIPQSGEQKQGDQDRE